jgi:2-oxoisovalerate dehydrogenase E2 component (dihydrolipoyl transacylase)
MAKSMTASWSVPHFGYCDEVVMDDIIALRKDLKVLADKANIKFSYMPIILKVCMYVTLVFTVYVNIVVV